MGIVSIRKIVAIIFMSLALAGGVARAQYVQAPADISLSAASSPLSASSLSVASSSATASPSTVPSPSAFKAGDLIAPGIIGGAGLVIHFFGHDSIDASVRDWALDLSEGRPVPTFDNYIQYLPLTLDMGLGLVGVPAKHGFMDRFIEASISHLTLGILSGGGKLAFHTLRPNGADYKSFPSGHSDFAFAGAELVRMEYGWGWGSAAYATATTVACMRVYKNRHWLSDVLFGAGLGMLCAHVGDWLLEPTKDLLSIETTDWGSGHKRLQAAFAPTLDPYSGSLCASLAVNF